MSDFFRHFMKKIYKGLNILQKKIISFILLNVVQREHKILVALVLSILTTFKYN